MDFSYKLEMKVGVHYLVHQFWVWVGPLVWLDAQVVGLGAAGLNLFGAALFLFSAALSFLMLGLVSGSGGLNWLVGAGPIFPSTSQKGFHLLYNCEVGVKSCVPRHTFDQLCCLVCSEYMCPLHGCDFHFYIHHFYWESAPEVTMQEVTLGLEYTSHV